MATNYRSKPWIKDLRKGSHVVISRNMRQDGELYAKRGERAILDIDVEHNVVGDMDEAILHVTFANGTNGVLFPCDVRPAPLCGIPTVVAGKPVFVQSTRRCDHCNSELKMDEVGDKHCPVCGLGWE